MRRGSRIKYRKINLAEERNMQVNLNDDKLIAFPVEENVKNVSISNNNLYALHQNSQSSIHFRDKENNSEIKEHVSKECRDKIYNFILDAYPRRENFIYAHYNHVSSVSQIRPTCGFCALSMASQLLFPVGANKLFNEAKRLGITEVGEMFDAYTMAEFASRQLNCDTKVLSDLGNNLCDLLVHICEGWPVLIAYDNAGKYPAVHFGETAHWAVLTGVMFENTQTKNSYRRLNISISDGNFVKPAPKQTIEVLLSLFGFKPQNYVPNIIVFAREGLSKEIAVWPLKHVLLSNRNLRIYSKKYGLKGDYDLTNLRNKAILLKRTPKLIKITEH